MMSVSRFLPAPVAIALVALSSVSAALAKTCAPEHEEAVVDAVN
jgi:hypothetical protein